MTQRKKEQVKMDLPLVRPINDVEVDINKEAIFCFFFQTIYLLNLLKADIYSFKSLLFFFLLKLILGMDTRGECLTLMFVPCSKSVLPDLLRLN